jgi:GAF domain-containing protein
VEANGALRPELGGTWDRLVRTQAQEGPCLDAYHTGERIACEILDAESGRWPSFTAAALDAGFRSASAIPLRWRDTILGALNLLSTSPDPMDEADSIVARAFADLAAVSIVHHRASIEARRLNEQLSGALTSRVIIEQAKGVLSERAGIDLAEAFSRMRAYARDNNLRLTDVAQQRSLARSILGPRGRQLAPSGGPVGRGAGCFEVPSVSRRRLPRGAGCLEARGLCR